MTSANVHLARLAGWFLLLAVVTVILGATLGHSHPGYHSANLRPGHDLWLELRHVSPQTGVVNIAGNVVMFVPVGFLLVTAVGDGVLRAVTGGALLSATIECFQYQIGRAADIDDVLLNATGAAVGALAASLVLRAVHSRRAGTVRG